ncbi:MAG TPA: mycofactocin-coupled SDR family oxidoreductase [Sporichthyaceae bacterium]|nr:mycofactocin-coupled SDR family oxidoreductase [Sporichthyaceae bacterium]
MGRVSGKVALITGAARGQGRAHAIRLAEEGADIVAVDACTTFSTVPYDLATPDDLAQTAKLVEERDRRVLARQVDVRDLGGLKATVADAVAEFGGIDIVVANAGIGSYARSWELTEEQWEQMLGINLTGVWKTTTACIPAMIDGGRGGSIILTSSLAGLLPYANLSHYVAAKHGVTGLMRALAVELAPHNIRVNSVHPTIVNTDMVMNDATRGLFLPHLENPTQAEIEASFAFMHALNVPWCEPSDISNLVLFLASEESRCMTGTTQVIDLGAGFPFKIPHS